MTRILVKVQRTDIPENAYAFNRMALRATDDDRAFLATEQWLFGTDNPNLIGSRGTQMARQLRATITAGGSGYTSAPTVTCSDGSTAVATISGGAVARIDFTYMAPGTTAPTLTISGGGGSVATATCARGTAPTISSNFLTTAATSAAGNALSTNILMSAVQSYALVVKRVGAGTAQMIVGGRQTAVSPVNGFNLFHSSSTDAYFAQFGGESAAQNIGQDTNAVGDWIGISVGHTGSSRIATIGTGVSSTKSSVALVSTPAVLCLGNDRFGTFSGGVAVECAAMVVFPIGATADEQILHMAKLRTTLAARGITVKT